MVPEFSSWNYPQPQHDRFVQNLPGIFFAESRSSLYSSSLHPLDFFQLFFIPSVFVHIVKTTNTNAERKQGYLGQRQGRKVLWCNISVGEMIVFIALIIYMGIYYGCPVEEYWARDGKSPDHRYIAMSCYYYIVYNF